MAEETTIKVMEALAKNGVQIGQLIVDNHGTMTLSNNQYGAQQEAAPENSEPTVPATTDQIGQALEAVGGYMWGQSAHAIIFCTLRDLHGYADNMSKYERDWGEIAQKYHLEISCPEGTLRSAFFSNSFLKFPVTRWQENGAPERAMKLMEQFEEQMARIAAQESNAV